MIDSSQIAGEVLSGSAALAGLILVYLGSLATGYGSYDVTQQGSVRSKFQKRAWFAFAGLCASLLAAGLALIGKWFDLDCLTSAAAVIFIISLVWGGITALLTVWEID